MIEYFDVVDKNDELTGEKTTKDKAHSKAILHRCIAVFVFDSSGKLYIQKHWSGLLDHTVGGHVAGGENYKTAAVRETEEEIGLKRPLKLVANSVYADETINRTKPDEQIRHMFGIFECQADPAWEFVLNSEVKEIYPLSLEEVVDQMKQMPSLFTQGFIYTMGKYIEAKGLKLQFNANQVLKNWGQL